MAHDVGAEGACSAAVVSAAEPAKWWLIQTNFFESGHGLCAPPSHRKHTVVIGVLAGWQLGVAGDFHGGRARVPSDIGAEVAGRDGGTALGG